MTENSVEIKATDFDQHDGQETQYSHKPLDPKELKLVINETIVRQVVRIPLDIQRWRAAHINAESRYFPNRIWLYDLYDDCLLDGHLTGIIGKRWDTVLNKKIEFKRNGKPDDSFKTLIKSVAFRNTCRTILESQEWGISGIEFEPGPVFSPRFIPRKHIKPKWQVISFEQSGKEGIDYTTAKNILIVGEPEDLGFLLKCCAYVIYKRNCFGDYAQYITIFGQPIRVMKYDATDQQAKIELRKTLKESGGALELMIPNGVEFELMDGKESNGDGKLQKTFIDTCNQENSIIVLGNTETTTNGQTGSQAKSKVHKQQQDEVSLSDMFYLTSWLNSDQFLLILKSYGFDVEGGEFEIKQELNIEFLERLIAIWVQLPETLPISDDDWYDTFGVPKPDNYDELKKEIEKRQKALQGVDDIQNDPTNVPAKKPVTKKDIKQQLNALQRQLNNVNRRQVQPDHGKPTLRSLIRTVRDFFA